MVLNISLQRSTHSLRHMKFIDLVYVSVSKGIPYIVIGCTFLCVDFWTIFGTVRPHCVAWEAQLACKPANAWLRIRARLLSLSKGDYHHRSCRYMRHKCSLAGKNQPTISCCQLLCALVRRNGINLTNFERHSRHTWGAILLGKSESFPVKVKQLGIQIQECANTSKAFHLKVLG